MNLESLGVDIATTVRTLNGILTSICQLLALLVISIGITRALLIYLKGWLFNTHSSEVFQRSRLAMGYSFSLGLSFLVGSSILTTMISSQWDDIARLVAIIAVRTVLNYLLIQAIHSTPEIQESSVSVPIAKPITSSVNHLW